MRLRALVAGRTCLMSAHLRGGLPEVCHWVCHWFASGLPEVCLWSCPWLAPRLWRRWLAGCLEGRLAGRLRAGGGSSFLCFLAAPAVWSPGWMAPLSLPPAWPWGLAGSDFASRACGAAAAERAPSGVRSPGLWCSASWVVVFGAVPHPTLPHNVRSIVFLQ